MMAIAGQEIGDRGDASPDRAHAQVPEAEDELGGMGGSIRAVPAHAVEADRTLPRSQDDGLLLKPVRQVGDGVKARSEPAQLRLSP
jgi:hypothetical protein